MRCNGCGSEITPGDTYCQECGIRVTGGRPPVPDAGASPEVSTAGDAGTEAGPPAQVAPPGADAAAAVPGPPPGPPAASPPVPPVSPPPAPARRAKRKTSGLAVASLVLGITCFFLVPIIGAILAIVFGAVARGSIRRSKGELGGKGMATAGLTLGIIGLVLPLVIVAVAVPLGVKIWWPKVEARRDLLKGVETARVFYYQNNSSYTGMTADRLAEIDETVEFRDAAGSEPDVVYVQQAGGQAARLYCYSRMDDRYRASATGTLWEYSFKVTEPERERWWEDWDEWSPF